MRSGTLARILPYAACLIAASGLTQTAMGQAGVFQNPPSDLGTQTMPANDGWASVTWTGTFPAGSYTAPYAVTGGSAATSAHIYTVTTFAQLKTAMAVASPKIIYVQGEVDAVGKDGVTPLGRPGDGGPCAQFYVAPYTMAAYIGSATSTTTASAAQTTALNSSESAYSPFVTIAVTSNTTLVGIGNNAIIKGINLTVASSASNVIIRNITFKDAIDCFPVWTPTDHNSVNPFYEAVNSSYPGNFNSNFDNISWKGGTHFWIDHCTFTDDPDSDATQPIFFNRPYQWHDGALDITNASDYGTVSWTIFSTHGKTNLIGGSDGTTTSSDYGHLRVTFHHNIWTNTEEREPRVRFGALDIYNNYYAITNGPGYFGYVYSMAAGVYSHLYAQNNAWTTSGSATAFDSNQILYFYGNLLQQSACFLDSRWNNPDAVVDPIAGIDAAINSWPPTDVVSATGITVAQTLTATGGVPIVSNCAFWTPTLAGGSTPIRMAAPDNTKDVPALVLSGAVASPSVAPVSGFGGVTLGQNTSQTVTLHNNGAGILLINAVTATGDFSISSNNCQTSLAANSSCQLSVVFTPTALGPRTGTLSFSDWASSSPQQVSLSGAGLVAPAVTLTTTGAVTGTHSGGYTMTVTIKNTGGSPANNVVLNAATLGTTSGTPLPQTWGTIAAGGTGTFIVSVPGSAGLDGAGVAEKFSGTYTGGSFSASIRSVTLP